MSNMRTIENRRIVVSVQRTLCVSHLTRPLRAMSEVRICCAHSRHSEEQSAWMEGGKLSISTRTYHSILHQIPSRNARTQTLTNKQTNKHKEAWSMLEWVWVVKPRTHGIHETTSPALVKMGLLLANLRISLLR